MNIIMFILIVFAVIIIAILMIYNSLVRRRNYVKQSQSGIDIYLNQRFDLIPNLVETVKGYSKHEEELFTDISRMRTSYMNNDQDIKSAENLNNKLNQLLAIAESYPELHSSEQFLGLQRSLAKMEDQLQAARRIYNMAVTRYNNKIQTIPSNLVANLFGFKEAELFEIEEYKRENVSINLGN